MFNQKTIIFNEQEPHFFDEDIINQCSEDASTCLILNKIDGMPGLSLVKCCKKHQHLCQKTCPAFEECKFRSRKISIVISIPMI